VDISDFVLNNMLRLKSPARTEVPAPGISGIGVLPQPLFTKFLRLERKRTERSRRGFVLMLLDLGKLPSRRKDDDALAKIVDALSQSIRETDLTGWYKDRAVLGVIFTETASVAEGSLVKILSVKVTEALYRALTVGQINEIRLTFHIFPEDWDDDSPDGPVNSSLHVDLAQGFSKRTVSLQAKRMLDIVGSVAAILACLPVFIAIAAAIKLTSKGPVFYRQVRLGQYGRKFTFLKFRSMYFKNDPSIHQHYVKQFIAGGVDAPRNDEPAKPFKLVADPRVTAVGGFLRKTSLDELPQFFNVLKGEMSLVGPRPPVTYEYEYYDLWHKERLLAVKPGITGLWQVDGRSRVTFDDMVRLDLRYARAWSLWLDIKLLLRTPYAVLTANGAH
jgi:lipopolysaccharide/colanic/teichoic acid biosynthesis glycosyltransferase